MRFMIVCLLSVSETMFDVIYSVVLAYLHDWKKKECTLLFAPTHISCFLFLWFFPLSYFFPCFFMYYRFIDYIFLSCKGLYLAYLAVLYQKWCILHPNMVLYSLKNKVLRVIVLLSLFFLYIFTDILFLL